MPVPHYAKRSLAALTLILAVLTAGCGGGDSNAPNAPFDPEGTSSDIGAMEASFDSPAMLGYASAADAISAVLAGSPAAAAVKAAPTKMLVVGGKQGAAGYAATVAKTYMRPAGGVSAFSTAAILDEHLGVTFTYNPDTDQYEASELPGAPVDGVRFIIYAVNGITGAPVEPLVEVGYADIVTTEVTTETASSFTVRVEVVSAGVTYLDYSVGATANASGATVTVSGFVTNGDDLVDFDLDTHIGSESWTLDYTLTVPTRNGFRLDFEAEINIPDATVTTTLEARGSHGTVTISGSQSTTAGSFEVRVNGELFATITTSESGPTVITGAGGEPLTQAELEALQTLFVIWLEGFGFMGDLLYPIPV